MRMNLKAKEIVSKPTTVMGFRVENDANNAKEALLTGETIARFERGNSMHPLLKDGEYAVISPLGLDGGTLPKVGDSVFCNVNGYLMTHMIVAISDTSVEGRMYLIGSSHFDLFGWTNTIYGIAKGTNIFEAEEGIDNTNINNINFGYFSEYEN